MPRDTQRQDQVSRRRAQAPLQANVGMGSIRARVEPAASPGMVRYAAERGSKVFYRDATGCAIGPALMPRLRRKIAIWTRQEDALSL